MDTIEKQPGPKTTAWPVKAEDLMPQRNSIAFPTFYQFICKNKINRKYFLIVLFGCIIQFVVFKILYPFPDFISDSYSYIHTNLYYMSVNLWPIGYSKFLWLIHQINHSDTFLIAVQYFLLQTVLVYLFFTIRYLYQPAKNISFPLLLFLFFNPLFLYISNCVLSDALFATLTILLIIQFLWMLHRPTLSQVIIQGIIIGVAFTIRYTAIFYPLIAICGFLLSRHKILIKVLGSLLGIAFILPFYIYTQQKTKEITGTSQFSVFGGWQIANNALYMYDHIKVDSNKLPAGTQELDRMVRSFYKHVPPQYRELEPFPGTYFIKVPYAVLKPYMAARATYNDPPGQFRAWGIVSPIYQKYATYLITHYPLAFVQYYLWLNTKNYFFPHLEKFGIYNLGISTVPPEVQEWFDYKTPDVHTVSATFQRKLFFIYPIIFMALNLYFTGWILWLLLNIKKISSYFRRTLLFNSVFLILNFGFSVFATPVVLRYQIVPIIILFAFSLLLLEFPKNKVLVNQK